MSSSLKQMLSHCQWVFGISVWTLKPGNGIWTKFQWRRMNCDKFPRRGQSSRLTTFLTSNLKAGHDDGQEVLWRKKRELSLLQNGDDGHSALSSSSLALRSLPRSLTSTSFFWEHNTYLAGLWLYQRSESKGVRADGCQADDFCRRVCDWAATR